MEEIQKPKFYRLASLAPESCEGRSNKNKIKIKTLDKQRDDGLTISKKSNKKILGDFLAKAKKGLKKKGIGMDRLEEVFRRTESLSLPQFIESAMGLVENFEPIELGVVFKVLTRGDQVNSSDIIRVLNKEMDSSSSSSKSSDISSPSDGEYIEESIEISKVSEVFEILSFKIHSYRITREIFSEITENHFGNTVSALSLNKFLLKKEFRIEDGPTRNMLISFVLGDRREILTGKFLEVFTDECFSGEINELNNLLKDEARERFIALCKKQDIRKSGYLAWWQMQEILEACRVEPSKDVKYHCYRIEKSLDMIPYQLV